MSKMVCHCGGAISDSLYPCPTEGEVLPQQDQELYFNRVCRDIAGFFAALQAGRRDEWLAAYFNSEYSSETDDVEGILHDIISFIQCEVFLSVAECEKCGRLWIQDSVAENSYRSYAPDVPGYAGVLQSKTANSGEPIP